MVEELVTLQLYKTATQITAVLSILVMALTSMFEGYHDNDVYYAAVITVIAIGPRILEKIGESEEGQGRRAGAARVGAAVLPFVGIAATLLRFLVLVA